MRFSTPVFVPTRGNRKYLLRMAEQLHFCEEVYFLASYVDTSGLPSNCHPIEMTGQTRQAKRQQAILMSQALELPYCIQVDDDIKADFETILPEFVRLMELYPSVGSVCSLNRVAFDQGWHPEEVSHPFIIKNFPSQVVALRLKAYEETRGYRLYTMDDVDMGAQLWEKGWLSIATRIGKHAETRARGGSPSQGGLPGQEYEDNVMADIEIMKTLPMLTKVGHRFDKHGRTRPVLRWDWSKIQLVTAEVLGHYKDTKFDWSWYGAF